MLLAEPLLRAGHGHVVYQPVTIKRYGRYPDLTLLGPYVVLPEKQYLKLRFLRCNLAALADTEGPRDIRVPCRERVAARRLRQTTDEFARKKTFSQFQTFTGKIHIVSEVKRVEFANSGPGIDACLGLKIGNTATDAQCTMHNAECENQIVHFALCIVHF